MTHCFYSKKKSCLCSRTEIVWAKGDQLFSGRKRRARHSKISVSRKGILKIKDIDTKEAGRYTCLGKFTLYLLYTIGKVKLYICWGLWQRFFKFTCSRMYCIELGAVCAFSFILSRRKPFTCSENYDVHSGPINLTPLLEGKIWFFTLPFPIFDLVHVQTI